jgi:Tol biopolymer transport system component
LNSEEFPTVDAPFFSPDNQFLYFSAVSEQPQSLTWWEKLMGVRIAFARSSAHNVPSDFWRVSLIDGEVEQMTDIQDQGMYGTFSPDGEWIAFTSATGLYVMRPDGSGLVQMIEIATMYGTLDWIP